MVFTTVQGGLKLVETVPPRVRCDVRM